MKVGIDWGGTKIEAIVLDPSTGKELLRKRVDAPKENYVEIINTVFKLITDISSDFTEFTVGIGMPGSLHPNTGLVQVSNTKALEGQDVKNDLENRLGIDIRIANDADCLALSEAIDGAGKDYKSVFAVIYSLPNPLLTISFISNSTRSKLFIALSIRMKSCSPFFCRSACRKSPQNITLQSSPTLVIIESNS